MFKALNKINERPRPFETYSAPDLWTDPHIAEQMLKYHLHPEIDAASRNSEFLENSIEWIIKKFNLKSGRNVADFGCGPGLYTTPFARTGASVTGIDFSSNSINYARAVAQKESVPINYINGNYLDYRTDHHFDLITMIMCDFCVLSPVQRSQMIRKFYSLLKPGASVLLDAYSIKAFNSTDEKHLYESNLMDGFWSGNKYYGFMNRFKYEHEKVILDKYTIIEADRCRYFFNWLQYFDPKELAAEFKSHNFSFTTLLGDVAGSRYQNESNEFALIVTK